MIRSLFAVALLALSACYSLKTNEPKTAWEQACAHSTYSCRGVKEPLVVEADLADRIYGEYFPGTKHVIITVGLHEPKRTLVLAHEMTHYLQWVHKMTSMDDSKAVRCEREKEAFDVSYAVSIELGVPDTRWQDIAFVYGCPLNLG